MRPDLMYLYEDDSNMRPDLMYQYEDDGLKLVVIGDTAVGKTHLCLSLMDHPTYQFDDEFTFEDSFNHTGIYKSPSIESYTFPYDEFRVDGKRIKFRVHDRAGKDMANGANDWFYTDALGALVVYDITNPDSFHRVEEWLEVVRDQTHRADLPVMLVGNKSDLVDSRRIKKLEGQKSAVRLGCPFMETSALEKTNVVKAFEILFKEILRLQKTQIEEFNPHHMDDFYATDNVGPPPPPLRSARPKKVCCAKKLCCCVT